MYSSWVRMGLLQTHQPRHLLLGKHVSGFLSQLNHSPAANWYTNGSGLSEDIALTISRDVKEWRNATTEGKKEELFHAAARDTAKAGEEGLSVGARGMRSKLRRPKIFFSPDSKTNTSGKPPAFNSCPRKALKDVQPSVATYAFCVDYHHCFLSLNPSAPISYR